MLLYGPTLYWSAQYACYYMVPHCTEVQNMRVIIWSHIVLNCTICMLLYCPTLNWSVQYAFNYMVSYCTEVYNMHVITCIWSYIVLICTICMLLYGPTLYWRAQYAYNYIVLHCAEVYNMHVIIWSCLFVCFILRLFPLIWSYIVLKCTICILLYGPTLYWSVQYACYYMVLRCTEVHDMHVIIWAHILLIYWEKMTGH
jgi:hypothetical protein